MTVQFGLGAKHLNCVEKTKELIAEAVNNTAAGASPKEIVHQYLMNSFGSTPAKSEIYSDYLGMAVSMEELSKKDSLSAYILTDQVIFGEILSAYTSAKPEDFLKKGETISLLCMESGFSGINSLRTKAVKIASGWQVEGTKLISNEQIYSEKFLVFAKGEDNKLRLFIIPEENVQIEETENNIASSKIIFNQVKFAHALKEEQCIAVIDDNFEKIMAIARMLIAAVCVGIAHSALAKSIEMVKATKDSNGDNVSTSQNIQFTLADMYSEIEAARALTYLSADTIDNGKNAIKLASMAKVKASEAANNLTMESLHLLGNVGFIANTDFASLMQRSADGKVKGGTNRLQKSQIYDYMLAKK